MPVFQPTYREPKSGRQIKSAMWWYDFTFAGKRIREPAKTKLKTLARMAEQKRHRELEVGFNGLADNREAHMSPLLYRTRMPQNAGSTLWPIAQTIVERK